jgi:hypothetical protein
MAYGHAHRLASSEKQRHEMAADETGSAEHRDSAGHDLFSQHSPEIAWAMHYRRRSVLFKGFRPYATVPILY